MPSHFKMMIRFVMIWSIIFVSEQAQAETFVQPYIGAGYVRTCNYLTDETKEEIDDYCFKGGRVEWGLNLSWDKIGGGSKNKKSNRGSVGFNIGSGNSGGGGDAGKALVALIVVIVAIYVVYGLVAGLVSLFSDSIKFGLVGSAQYLVHDELASGGEKIEIPSQEYGFRTTVMISKDWWLGTFFQISRISASQKITSPVETINVPKEYGYRYSWGLGFMPPSDKSGLYLYGQIFQDSFNTFRPNDLRQSEERVNFDEGLYSATAIIGYTF